MAAPAATADFGSTKFDFAAIEKFGGADVAARFREALITGEKTTDDDAKVLEKALYEFCCSHGCINYAHW